MPPSCSQTAASGDDAEIVRLLRAREPAGLRLLLGIHGPGVRTCVRRTLGDALSETEMDDVINKAAFHAWRCADTFDAERGTLRAWFLVIARNAARGILREQQRRGFEVRGDELDGVAATAADDDEPPSQPPPGFLQAVHECIEALPRLQRSIIEADLRSGTVASAEELARTLKTTKNSIYVSRSMARQNLRRKLLAQGYVPGSGRSQPLWS
jgi:RNA polymerase sigma factor (sigma-70 family)